MSGRQPDWDVDRRHGEEAESLFAKLGNQTLSGTAEVKRDMRALDTGRVYIEHECRTSVGWRPSGIQSTKADTWVFVLGPVLLAVPTDAVRDLYRAAVKAGAGAQCVVGSHPTKGVLVDLRKLLPWLARWAAREAGDTPRPPPCAPPRPQKATGAVVSTVPLWHAPDGSRCPPDPAQPSHCAACGLRFEGVHPFDCRPDDEQPGRAQGGMSALREWDTRREQR